MTRKIYLATSWKNPYQEHLLSLLRRQGHEVYDFKNPKPGNTGFSWSAVDPNWQQWDCIGFMKGIASQKARDGFVLDYMGMHNADTCVILAPCGMSASCEAGWMKGQGKKVFLVVPEGERCPIELMFAMFDGVFASIPALLSYLDPEKLSKADRALPNQKFA